MLIHVRKYNLRKRKEEAMLWAVIGFILGMTAGVLLMCLFQIRKG